MDLARLFAAVLVLFGHARGAIFVGIGGVDRPTLLTKAVYLASSLQHEGVVIFFVISGFLIGGSLWQSIGEQTFDARRYFINRFSRIYIVYAPSLLLVLVLNWVGFSFFSDTRLYSQRPLFPSGVDVGWTMDQLYCHLVGIQGVFCPPWGSNPPLWSLGFEWLLYLIAPYALYALIGRNKTLRAAAAIVSATALYQCYLHNHDVLPFFLFWWAGCAAYVLGERFTLPAGIGFAGLALSVAAMLVSRLKVTAPEAIDSLIALGLFVAFSCRALVRFPLEFPIIGTGASFSYSLYLIHLPVIIFTGAAAEHFLGWPSRLVQPTIPNLAAFAALLALTAAAALVFAAATEYQTGKLRRFLSRMAAPQVERTQPASR